MGRKLDTGRESMAIWSTHQSAPSLRQDSGDHGFVQEKLLQGAERPSASMKTDKFEAIKVVMKRTTGGKKQKQGKQQKSDRAVRSYERAKGQTDGR